MKTEIGKTTRWGIIIFCAIVCGTMIWACSQVWENYTFGSFVASFALHGLIMGAVMYHLLSSAAKYILYWYRPNKTLSEVAEWFKERPLSNTLSSDEITGFLRNWYSYPEMEAADIEFKWLSGSDFGRATMEDFLKFWKNE